MRTFPRAWSGVICALALAGWWSCPGGVKGANYFGIHAQDEAQFLVEQTVADIAEMAYYAANRTLPEAGKLTVDAREKTNSPWATPEYAVEIKLDAKTVKVDVAVNKAIWAPEVYAGATKAIFEALGIAKKDLPESAQDRSLLKALLDGEAGTIAVRDRGLSEALTENMSGPELHEKAAVLLGAFALRDSAGEFEDERLAMCRMAAHLAFSQGLMGQATPGINGRLAKAMLLTLMNNERDALGEIDNFKVPELSGWGRILRARNTDDYRELEKSAPSVLEKIELFRARAAAVNTGAAWKGHTNEMTEEQLPDYYRVLCKFGYSVQIGHVVNALAVPLETRELATMFRAYEGKSLDDKNLTEALSAEPERCVTRDAAGKAKVRVIGWGQWSFFSERHIEQAMTQNYYFLLNSYGVPEEATALAKESARLFSKIPLYPWLDWQLCTNEEGYRRAITGMAALTQKSPQLISPQEWKYLYLTLPFIKRVYFAATNYHTSDWYQHNPLPGTAHEGGYRVELPGTKGGTPRSELAASLVAMAPHDVRIVTLSMEKFINRTGGSPSFKDGTKYEDVEPYYRGELDYNLHLMDAAAVTLRERPAEYEKLMLKEAVLSPEKYFLLGHYFIQRDDENKGMGYLEKGIALADDDVYKANIAGELIPYYVKRGRKTAAYKLADFAADEVYSLPGLRAKADLLESDGRYLEALDYFKKIAERYDNTYAVPHFYARYNDKVRPAANDPILQDELRTLFPDGLERAKLGNFSGPPKDGVALEGESAEMTKAGLGNYVVVVALNGVRVRNIGQFSYVRQILKVSEMTLIVWNANRYQEVKASPPDHRFGVSVDTYQP